MVNMSSIALWLIPVIKMASTSFFFFLHLGANYVQVKERNGQAEWRRGQTWRSEGHRSNLKMGVLGALIRKYTLVTWGKCIGGYHGDICPLTISDEPACPLICNQQH